VPSWKILDFLKWPASGFNPIKKLCNDLLSAIMKYH